jgi:hypothetical protein
MSGYLLRYSPGGGVCNLGANIKNVGPPGPPGPAGPRGATGVNGSGSSVGPSGAVQFSNGNGLFLGSGGLIFDGSSNGTTGNLFLRGNLIPPVDNVYTLGTSGNRWNHLYVGPNSITIGDIEISTDNEQITFTNTSQVSNGTSVTLSTITGGITTENAQGQTGSASQVGPTGPTGPVTSYIFDGGNAGSSYIIGPAFDCGSSV